MTTVRLRLPRVFLLRLFVQADNLDQCSAGVASELGQSNSPNTTYTQCVGTWRRGWIFPVDHVLSGLRFLLATLHIPVSARCYRCVISCGYPYGQVLNAECGRPHTVEQLVCTPCIVVSHRRRLLMYEWKGRESSNAKGACDGPPARIEKRPRITHFRT